MSFLFYVNSVIVVHKIPTHLLFHLKVFCVYKYTTILKNTIVNNVDYIMLNDDI